jgi:hypothetical protein
MARPDYEDSIAGDNEEDESEHQCVLGWVTWS